MPEEHTDGTVIDELFTALEKGDVDAAIACLTEDATVWHAFDRVAHDTHSIREDWGQLIAGSSTRRVTDVRRSATTEGFVQQHLMTIHTRTGAQLAWPVCIVVQVRDGRVARLDEYIDRAGHFTPTEDNATTPGLKPIETSRASEQ
ncbi:nuclear transport factor 2 family protein [Nocardia noduli]|uniref:nuclear transport factor 2 family protein n=1 Tax=Nocardia noduli TaxID=2815722 RepID=UPI001C22FD67|nr:nuclear transport factor 2 family protein [Nocardia noduli]